MGNKILIPKVEDHPTEKAPKKASVKVEEISLVQDRIWKRVNSGSDPKLESNLEFELKLDSKLEPGARRQLDAGAWNSRQLAEASEGEPKDGLVFQDQFGEKIRN